MADKHTWIIRIADYGSFEFEGSELEAEEMRRHKAQWEHGNGIKYCKSHPELVDKLVELQCWIFDNHQGCPRWLMNKIRDEKIKLMHTGTMEEQKNDHRIAV